MHGYAFSACESLLQLLVLQLGQLVFEFILIHSRISQRIQLVHIHMYKRHSGLPRRYRYLDCEEKRWLPKFDLKCPFVL